MEQIFPRFIHIFLYRNFKPDMDNYLAILKGFMLSKPMMRLIFTAKYKKYVF